ncbi:MAG: hypothetical protein AB7G93_21945 [Bdellovibrionales bacterium]
MKFKTFTGLVATLVAGGASATPATHVLNCSHRPGFEGSIRISLDAASFTPGSGYMRPLDGRLTYQFSYIGHMACDGIAKVGEFDFDCVGLYSGIREPMVTKIRNDGENIWAEWRTNRYYGNEEKRTPCQLEEIHDVQ